MKAIEWRDPLAAGGVPLPKLFTPFISLEIMNLFMALVEAPLCWVTIN